MANTISTATGVGTARPAATGAGNPFAWLWKALSGSGGGDKLTLSAQAVKSTAKQSVISGPGAIFSIGVDVALRVPEMWRALQRGEMGHAGKILRETVIRAGGGLAGSFLFLVVAGGLTPGAIFGVPGIILGNIAYSIGSMLTGAVLNHAGIGTGTPVTQTGFSMPGAAEDKPAHTEDDRITDFVFPPGAADAKAPGKPADSPFKWLSGGKERETGDFLKALNAEPLPNL